MNILRTLSGNLSRIKPAPLVAVALTLGASMGYVFLVVLEEIRAVLGQPDFEVVDAFYIRPPSLTFHILNTMGTKGRILYMRIAATDVLIPACLALLLGGLMAKAWRVSPTRTKHEGLAWMLPVLPVMGAAADYMENFCTLFHMWRLPHQDMAVARIGTVATFVKYSLIFGSMPVIALGFWANRPRAKKGKAFA